MLPPAPGLSPAPPPQNGGAAPPRPARRKPPLSLRGWSRTNPASPPDGLHPAPLLPSPCRCPQVWLPSAAAGSAASAPGRCVCVCVRGGSLGSDPARNAAAAPGRCTEGRRLLLSQQLRGGGRHLAARPGPAEHPTPPRPPTASAPAPSPAGAEHPPEEGGRGGPAGSCPPPAGRLVRRGLGAAARCRRGWGRGWINGAGAA